MGTSNSRCGVRQRAICPLRASRASRAARSARRLVFTREDGALIHPGNLSTIFDRLVRVSTLPRLSLHGLRHTHATILMGSSVPVKVVSERLGHATVQITLDTYSHVQPGMQAQAAAAFATAMRGA